MPRVKIGPALPDRATLDIEIARLRDLDVGQLRSRWHTAFGRPAPAHLSRHLLFRSLAYRLQADRLGEAASFAVLFVAYLLHPIHDLAVEPVLNGDVRHRRRRRCAVPMLFARRKPDDIARPDFLDRTAPALRPPDARSDDRRLPERMGMATRCGHPVRK
jgi:hypothetical protein